ncbi:MAG: hypothetical protein KGI54_13795 [Pseudomonadota bacterium]|nr:hypothetical protein [Pseudomonadota bacterium]
MGIILTHWKLIAIGLILVALGGYIFTITEERDLARSHLAEAQAEIQSIKSQSEAIQAQAIARNKAIERQNEQTNQELANDYAKTVAAIHANGNRGIACKLRVNPHRDSGPMPQTPNTAQRVDATPSNDVVARLPADCAITTAIALGLQKFVREECTAR